MRSVSLTVNGKAVLASVEPRLNLADFLRDHQLLTGTHIGCEHGVCGACTLIVNGEPARSCIALAVACDGAEVRTIEDLDEDPIAIRLRAAFTAEHGLQCGYCTPGMLVTARDIVLRLPDADAERIRLELSGNLCRCTGYAGIVRAIERVLRERPAVEAPAKAPVAERRMAAPAATTVAAPVRTAAPVSASPDSTLRQTIGIALPPDRVWAAIKDPTLVASCVPGVTLAPSSSAGNLAGEMAVAFGPLRARFAGTATVSYDDAAWSGTIRGEGRDSATGTRLKTEAEFRVSEAGAGKSRIDLTAAYALQGPLAQFSRGALVQALAGELCREIARNLEARLTGGTATPPQPAKFSAGAFLLGVIWRRLKALFGND
ncbi:MAG TPA: 2Fe-2S iron-sulfur cluster-binding protein [Stellaceae bacterium]|nr:2Fe-2S iron-sulfur cluster-binding protein [Stellaceae bacterium]